MIFNPPFNSIYLHLIFFFKRYIINVENDEIRSTFSSLSWSMIMRNVIFKVFKFFRDGLRLVRKEDVL